MNDQILATYRLLAARREDVAPVVSAFASGQSVGTWLPLPGLTPELVARHAATVVDLSEPRPIVEIPSTLRGARLPAGPDAHNSTYVDAVISFPSRNFDTSFAMLWTTVLGNDPSTGINASLIDLEFPDSMLSTFAGPRLGIRGWRQRLGSDHRPLLLTPLKPSIGLSPADTAALAAEVARGGVDVVKDDEVLASAEFSGVAERVEAVRAALDSVAKETGRRTRYVVSITSRARDMLRHADAAVASGADGVMIAALAVGLDALQTLAEHLDGRLPIIAHTAAIDVWAGRAGLGLAPDLLIRLCRLAGADAVLIGSPWARRATPLGLWQQMANRLRDSWSGIEPAFPIVGGGVAAEQVADIVRLIGPEVIITAGGSVTAHPDGARAGARQLRRARDTALSSSAALVETASLNPR